MTNIKGIRERSGSFMADVTIDGKRKTKTFKKLEDAIAFRSSYESATKSGADVAPILRGIAKGTWTLKDAYHRTYEDYWKNCKSVKAQVLNAGYALKHFGDKCRVADITLDRIREYKQKILDSGNAPTTCDRKTTALSKMLRTAVEEGKLATKPSFKTILSGLSKEDVCRTAYLTEEDEKEFLRRVLVHAQCETNGRWKTFHDFVCFLIDTGARTYGEGLSLTNKPNPMVSCIQWHNNTILFPVTKTGKPRSVPMTPRVKRILTARDVISRSKNTNKIWIGLTKDSTRHYWDTIRAEMGWKDDRNYCPYICRHTCASRLVIRGVSLPMVMQWMGHKQWSTTLGYAHLAPSDLNALADILAKPEDKVEETLTANKMKVAG